MALDPQGPMPQFIGHYRVDELVGKGGLGVVYRGVDTRLDRTVALKVPRAEFAHDPDVFKDEAAIGANIAHPNVCQVYACEIHDGTPHLVMQYVEGKTLSEFGKTRWLC